MMDAQEGRVTRAVPNTELFGWTVRAAWGSDLG